MAEPTEAEVTQIHELIKKHIQALLQEAKLRNINTFDVEVAMIHSLYATILMEINDAGVSGSSHLAFKLHSSYVECLRENAFSVQTIYTGPGKEPRKS